jgi:hypothetical protein
MQFNPELEYNVAWGNLLFENKKLNNTQIIYLDDNCYMVANNFIHDNLGRVSGDLVRLEITVAQDYVKKLDKKYLPDSTLGYANDNDIASIFEGGAS